MTEPHARGRRAWRARSDSAPRRNSGNERSARLLRPGERDSARSVQIPGIDENGGAIHDTGLKIMRAPAGAL